MSAAALLFFASVVATLSTAAQDAAPPLVLNITYTDGRTVPHIATNRTSGSWTPLFPKLADWRSADGLPVTAVDYRLRIEGIGVRVDVSVLLGAPHQRTLRVASVLVEPDQPVTVEALREFGVQPVALAVGAFVPAMLYQPQVENKTAALQVEDVEIVTTPSPGYRVTVRNYSSKPVMTFQVETYEGTRPRSIGRQGHRDGTPVVPSGGTFDFRINTDRTRDRIRITGLMFEDGTIEGDADGVALARVIYEGRRHQLQRVLELFGPASRAPGADPAATVASLAAQVDALSVVPDAAALQAAAGQLPADGPFTSAEAISGAFSAALREVRDGVLSDLTSAPRERGPFDQWLKEITALYRKWYLRFIELTSR